MTWAWWLRRRPRCGDAPRPAGRDRPPDTSCVGPPWNIPTCFRRPSSRRAPRPETREPVVLEANELSGLSRAFILRQREVAVAKDVTPTCARAARSVCRRKRPGKSTVARCIVRLIDPTRAACAGGPRDLGMSRRLLQPHRKKIQIIFQTLSLLNPRITIGEHRRRPDQLRHAARGGWQRRANCRTGRPAIRRGVAIPASVLRLRQRIVARALAPILRSW